MMTHTPGPWTVGDLINMGGYRDYYQISCSPEHGDLNIEISNPFGIGLEETKANATLIAAAPDLLAALREITKGEGAFSRDPLTFANNTIENMKEIANTAIAKAKVTE